MSNDNSWIVDIKRVSDEAVPPITEKLFVGDTVLCISEKSRHRGMIGKITNINFVCIVEYPNTHLIGRHPISILKKVKTPLFDEELFKI